MGRHERACELLQVPLPEPLCESSGPRSSTATQRPPRLVLLGKLEGQGWDVRLRNGEMELRNRDGDLFANVEKVNNVYPMGLTVIPPRARMAAWTTGEREPTHEELAERLEKVATVATARGAEGTKATLLTWHRRLRTFLVLMRVLHALRQNRYTPRTTRDVVVLRSIWVEFIST